MWAASIFFEEKVDEPNGRQGRKKKDAGYTFALAAIKGIMSLVLMSWGLVPGINTGNKDLTEPVQVPEAVSILYKYRPERNLRLIPSLVPILYQSQYPSHTRLIPGKSVLEPKP